MTQIIGVVLVKDEDLHIEWVLRNILDFCDRILFLDNYSTDDTWSIVERIAHQHKKITMQKWRKARDSQKALIEYYGTDTWMFGVDGDEVFDPVGLKAIRKRVMDGEFNNVWNVSGNNINCINIDYKNKMARGYPSPPARGGTKIYNYKLVKAIKDGHRKERLHGHPIFYKEPDINRLHIGENASWETYKLRYLHLCFMPRSSKQLKRENSVANKLIRRIFHNPLKNPYGCRPGPKSNGIEYKMRYYKVGELTTKDISNFFALYDPCSDLTGDEVKWRP